MLPLLSSDSSGSNGGSGGGIRNSCGCSNNKGSSTSDGVKRVGCNSSGSNNNSTTSLHILTTAHTKRIVTRTAHSSDSRAHSHLLTARGRAVFHVPTRLNEVLYVVIVIYT